METGLLYGAYFVLFMPLLAAATVPLLQRYLPKYPLLGSTILYGLGFVYSFMLMVLLTESNISHQVMVGGIQFGYYADNLTAAALLIISVVSWQTILCSPKLWRTRDGFVSLFIFSLSNLCLFALILTDNLLFFLLFWSALDLGVFFGREWDKSRTTTQRLRVFLILQISSALVLGAVTALLASHQTTSFARLIQLREQINPLLLTWVLSIIFLGVGFKTAGFPYSFWSPVALFQGSNLPAFPLVYGVAAVLPGIHLLTRLHPLFYSTLIPVPVILGVAVFAGFALFPFLENPQTSSH